MKKGRAEEEKYNDLPFIMTTTENIEGYQIISYKEIVNSDVVMGTGFLSEFGASFDDFIGVRGKSFETKLEKAKRSAYFAMEDKAKRIGANSIIGIKFSIAVTSANMLIVSYIGTAVIRKEAIVHDTDN